MKWQLSIYLLLLATQSGLAQTSISLSSGLSNSTSEGKSNHIGNGQHLQADVYIPFYSSPSNNNNSFSIGLSIGGNYTRAKNLLPDNSNTASKYNLYNSTVTVNTKSDKSYSNSFSGIAGIQAQFSFGRFYIAPSINAGYLNFVQEGYVQTGSVLINGQQYEKDLLKKDQQKTTGLIIKPQLRAGYRVTESISLFAGASLISGPEMNHTTYSLLPDGGFKDNNTYEPAQLEKGTWTSTDLKSRYNFTEINMGVCISLGSSKRIKKQPGAASASYAAGRQVQPNSTDKSINEKGIKRNESIQSARPGNPIGGIIVKGGKKPGGNAINLISDENGKVQFEVQEAGDYLFQLTTPDQPAGKSISSKGVKGNRIAAMASPGNPIGGIVVKGGKNPGGNNINAVSNPNGQILLTNLEPGTYQLMLQAPTDNKPKESKKDKKKGDRDYPLPNIRDVIKTQV